MRLGILLLLAVAALQSAEPMRVLFLGNSYTYYNNLPEIFAGLARASGHEIETGMVVVGGSTLENLWANTDARQAIRSGHWDYVVLQEQSLLGGALRNGQVSVNNASVLRQGVFLFEGEIRKAGAKPVLMLTWARRTTPEQQSDLNDAYLAVGREVGALVVPAGPAWMEARRRAPDVELYMPDDSHPAPPGSYLAACTLLYTLFPDITTPLPNEVRGHPSADGMLDRGRTVVLAGLTEPQAVLFQSIAKEARAVSRDRPSIAMLTVAPGRPAPSDLEGLWTGELTYYPGATTFDLTLRFDKERCEGTASIRATGLGMSYEAPVSDCRTTADGLRFHVATLPLPSLYDSFHGNLRDGRLNGVVERNGMGRSNVMTGTWSLRRTPAR